MQFLYFFTKGAAMERKTTLKIIMSAAVGAAVITGIATGTAAHEPDGSSQESIVEFLKDCGCSVGSPIMKDITIHEKFGEVYENYNKLQKEQGFDLSRYRGESAVSYTFPVIGYINEAGELCENVEAHVLVYDGRIIGGDIASTELDGFMKGLRQ